MSEASQIKVNVQSAMKDAMRSKDKDRLAVIRLMLAAFKQVEVDERITLSDERVLDILAKMLKQRRDSIEQYTNANRLELAEIERAEIEIIQSFMPSQLSDEEINSFIDLAISEVDAKSPQDMGKIMGFLKERVRGRADMTQVGAKVKERLAALS